MVSTSVQFNASDADVVIHSSDNVEFRLHKKNLECTTGAFPSADTPVDPDEIVRLTESAATLEILFQFTYPRRFPSLKDLDFDSLILLAEAAEKYEVVGLIYSCEVNLRRYLITNSMRVLEFSAKHDHLDLVDELKPILVETPLSELTGILPDHVYKPWSLYREQHLLARLANATTSPPASLDPCTCFRNTKKGSRY